MALPSNVGLGAYSIPPFKLPPLVERKQEKRVTEGRMQNRAKTNKTRSLKQEKRENRSTVKLQALRRDDEISRDKPKQVSLSEKKKRAERLASIAVNSPLARPATGMFIGMEPHLRSVSEKKDSRKDAHTVVSDTESVRWHTTKDRRAGSNRRSPRRSSSPAKPLPMMPEYAPVAERRESAVVKGGVAVVADIGQALHGKVFSPFGNIFSEDGGFASAMDKDTKVQKLKSEGQKNMPAKGSNDSKNNRKDTARSPIIELVAPPSLPSEDPLERRRMSQKDSIF